jgi:hypothetical protein
MYTIGFTTKFYTLWDVNTFAVWMHDGDHPYQVLRTQYQYIRNLSYEQASAIDKVKSLSENVEFRIDLTLKGNGSWHRDERIPTPPDPEAQFHFSFGKLKGRDIRTAGAEIFPLIEAERKTFAELETNVRGLHGMWGLDSERVTDAMREEFLEGKENGMRIRVAQLEKDLKDIVWQLDRAMKIEITARRKALARRRLIELGELVRRDWFEKRAVSVEVDPENDNSDAPMKTIEIKRKWMPKALYNYMVTIGDKKGEFYTAGKRIEIGIQLLRDKMYDSQYGTMHIVTYATEDGHIVTYKGNTPPKVAVNEFTRVVATVKHDRGETYLQRIAKPKTVNA